MRRRSTGGRIFGFALFAAAILSSFVVSRFRGEVQRDLSSARTDHAVVGTVLQNAPKWLSPFRWYRSPRSDKEHVILWWEKRRIPYNVVLLLLDVLVFAFLCLIYPRKGDPLQSALSHLFLPAIILQLTSNIWYTGGWVVELLVRSITGSDSHSFGPRALMAGTVFSLGFMTLVYALLLNEARPSIRQLASESVKRKNLDSE